MTNIQLSVGSVQQLRSKAPPAIRPVLQVISITQSTIGGAERYKLVLSDGQMQTGAILASQLNELAKKGDIRVNSILRLNEFIVNEMQNGFIVVILNVEILETASTTIGNPVDASERVVQQPVTNSNRVFAPAAVPTRSAPTFQAPEQQQFHAQAAPAQPQSWNQPPQASYQPPQASYQAPAPQTYAAQPKPAQYNAPVAQLQTMVGGGAAGSRAMPRTIPIKLINPYQNKWTIRARVTSKSDIRTWDKGPTNQGKLFSIDLVDNDGGEIRATFFREAVDLFFDTMRVGGVFLFSEGKVKVANRQFSAVKNEYELNFGKEAVIQPVQDDGDIARIHLNPISISDINNIEPKSTVDVLGVATEISDVTSFISKAGRDLRKMEMQLVDRSNTSIKLTVWGVKADEVANEVRNAGPNPIIAIKSAQVGDFGGRSLGTISSSSIFVNPHDIPQAGAVRSWFDNGGGRSGVSQLTAGREAGEARGPAPVKDRLTLDAIKTLGLGKNGQQDYCDVKGYLMFIKKDNMWYPACPTDKCNKKMTKSPAGDRWFCEKCNMDFEEPNYRYIASFQLADATGSSWCTAFNETANALFGGMSASELERLKRDDEARFEEVVNASCFQEGLFRLKVKEEQYNQQATVKYVVMNYRPIDYAAEVKELQKAIDMYEGKQ